MLRQFKQDNPKSDLFELPYRVAVHLNDTHPALAIPELMRILMDEHKFMWRDVSAPSGQKPTNSFCPRMLFLFVHSAYFYITGKCSNFPWCFVATWFLPCCCYFRRRRCCCCSGFFYHFCGLSRIGALLFTLFLSDLFPEFKARKYNSVFRVGELVHLPRFLDSNTIS